MTDKIQGMVKIGMAFGFVGILLIVAPIIKESTVCDKNTIVSNTSSLENLKTYSGTYDTCIPTGKLIAGLVSLMVAPVLWASATGIKVLLSSFKTFAKFYEKLTFLTTWYAHFRKILRIQQNEWSPMQLLISVCLSWIVSKFGFLIFSESMNFSLKSSKNLMIIWWFLETGDDL